MKGDANVSYLTCYYRAVVMVGLPFANLASASLKEKIKYVKEHAVRAIYKIQCHQCVTQQVATIRLPKTVKLMLEENTMRIFACDPLINP
jgi:hypothetical protein